MSANQFTREPSAQDEPVRILILGSGGREHALYRKIAASPRAEKVFVWPGNGLVSAVDRVERPAVSDSFENLLEFIRTEKIDMTVVGNETPLVHGVRDFLKSHLPGHLVFGPDRLGAQLEGSKAFSDNFMAEAGIPHGTSVICDSLESALKALPAQELPVVLKADGLAAGKGVVVAQTLNARNRLVVRLMLKIGATILFVGTLGFLASLFAIRRALAPFDRIGAALAERRPQDTAPLVIDSPREMQALIGAINEALRRLQDRMSKLQRFAGIAAHQIRTPLSALGAQTELLLSDKTSSARANRVERLRKHIVTLSRLTNQLLGQAMVSYRSERVPHERVEIIALIHQVLRDAIPESLDRDISVDFSPTEKLLYVQGDAISLREALVNLVSNAVVHGAPSLLRVRLTAHGSNAVISVMDDGPGIDPALYETEKGSPTRHFYL